MSMCKYEVHDATIRVANKNSKIHRMFFIRYLEVHVGGAVGAEAAAPQRKAVESGGAFQASG